MSKKVHQMPAPSPKVDSAAQLRYHQCRICSGMAGVSVSAQRLEGWPGVMKGNKEAQEKHQGPTDVLQKVQGLGC